MNLGCKLIAIFFLFSSALSAMEWPVLDGCSPTGEVEFVTIRKFDTDPINGSPFRIALRSRETNEVLDSFLWNGDMGDAEAHKMTRAYWSPEGKFVAVYTRGGRLMGSAQYFAVIEGKLKKVKAPDWIGKILEELGKKEHGPNGGAEPLKWNADDELIVSIYGAAGGLPYHYHATLNFSVGDDDLPKCKMVKLAPVE